VVRLFVPSPAKRLVRRLVDLPAIEKEYTHHGKRLTYFGLPSEGLYDVRDWQRYIGQIVAVERGDPYDPARRQAILLSKAIRLGLSERLVLLRGELNEIILQGKDTIGQKLTYPFELVNFDYGGTLLYPDRVRVEALEHFVREQMKNDFLLLITLNVREYDPREIDETQERIKAEVTQLLPTQAARVASYFQRMNNSNSPLRQVTHVLYLLRGLAEANHYRISWDAPILYAGSKGTPLIHYVVRFSFQCGASTKVVSDQGLNDILCVQPRILKGRKLCLAEEAGLYPSQHDAADRQHSSSLLET
jgi:hypothetical protein